MFYYFPIRAHTPCSTTGRGKLSGDLAPGFQKTDWSQYSRYVQCSIQVSVSAAVLLVEVSYWSRFGCNPTLAAGGAEGSGGHWGRDGSRNRMSRTNSLYLSTGAPDKQKTVLLFHNKKNREFPSLSAFL